MDIRKEVLKAKKKKFFDRNNFKPKYTNTEIDDINETIDLTLKKVEEVIDDYFMIEGKKGNEECCDACEQMRKEIKKELRK